MEQVIYSLLSGAGSGGLVVYLYQKLQAQLMKEEIRKEFYQRIEKAEVEANKYTDAKHSDMKEQMAEIKSMIAEIRGILINRG